MQNRFFEIEKKANQLRADTLAMCIKAGTGHVTSSMCCAEILATLYYADLVKHDPKNPDWPDRDRFVLSKGQASPILYALLADRGFFPKKWLSLFARGINELGREAPFGVHLQCTVPGVEFTTGSLGIGLGYAAGVAEVAKTDGKSHRVFVLLGDGELYEGSNWEVAGYAAHHKLNNLIAVVDRNGMCTNDYTEKIVALEPLDKKWEAYGWDVVTVNGHSVSQLYEALSAAVSASSDRPKVIIAKTIKGRGIPSMIGKLYLHGVTPTEEAADLAMRELSEFAKQHEAQGKYDE